MTPAGIKANAGGQILADQRPGPNKLRREYHALSRGWLANELVRRADPLGRTLGEFLQQEVAAPLGLGSSLSIGLSDPQALQRSVPLLMMPYSWSVVQSCVPNRCSLTETFGYGPLLQVRAQLAAVYCD